MGSMRLQRALARAGIASRRRAEELIRAGVVRVNGRPAALGTVVDPAIDVIVVRGRKLSAPRSRGVWIALHKPVGYVVTRRDPRGRPTVFELVPDIPGLTYVGRLDYMTAGLLLLTTDGAAAHRLTHPRYAVPRTYCAIVHGRPTAEIAARLRRPVAVDGVPVRMVSAQVRSVGVQDSELRVTLAEGRYRIVRRTAGALGLKVARLTRVSYGPVRLGRLAAGQWRYLTRTEEKAIQALTREGD